MGKLQNEDFKSQTELEGLGGSQSQLLNTDKMYHQTTDSTVKSELDDVRKSIPSNGAQEIYLGDPGTDGTWRLKVVGGALEIQIRTSGSYITKDTINP